jgi:hypothetical protein
MANKKCSPKNCKPRSKLVIPTLCVVVAIGLLPVLAHAAPALPPRPTPPLTPTPTPTPAIISSGLPSGGGAIELLVQPQANLWAVVYWQDLWTVVQWQDHSGAWHDVEGWRGTLDEVANGVGTKIWWVARADLGKGPFRWLIYRSHGGRLLATSQAFQLPGYDGVIIGVGVSVAP